MTIRWKNIGDSGGNAKITKQKKDQFKMYSNNGVEETTEYDCFSIMHYGSYQGSKNNKMTMVSRFGLIDAKGKAFGDTIPGHRYRLTEKDIQNINDKYPAPE